MNFFASDKTTFVLSKLDVNATFCSFKILFSAIKLSISRFKRKYSFLYFAIAAASPLDFSTCSKSSTILACSDCNSSFNAVLSAIIKSYSAIFDLNSSDKVAFSKVISDNLFSVSFLSEFSLKI